LCGNIHTQEFVCVGVISLDTEANVRVHLFDTAVVHGKIESMFGNKSLELSATFITSYVDNIKYIKSQGTLTASNVKEWFKAHVERHNDVGIQHTGVSTSFVQEATVMDELLKIESEWCANARF
jgi:hypothetical protein